MDKYEYKLKLEHIRGLVEAKNYKAAAEAAEDINWKKVKSVATLCMIGEIYEKTRKYEASREVLLMAYDRSPVGRNIIYRLTLVALKMGSLDEAQEYYEEFLEIAPFDNMKYVLRYEIARAKGAGLEEQISILEEFKEREYTEEWAFELAYLYHRNGKGDKCVEICDELILWFGEGDYVEKALELKMLYQPLNKLQEDKYRKLKMSQEGSVERPSNENTDSGERLGDTVRIPSIHSDTGKYNTVNLQAELAKSMKQIMEATEPEIVTDTMDNIKKMVGDIPNLHTAEMVSEALPETSLDINFQGMVTEEYRDQIGFSEEYDGQISLNVPDAPKPDPQITGQMSIEDILAEWERTKEAARIAIAEAEQRKLENTKARALQEAEVLMERLSAAESSPEPQEEPEELSEIQLEPEEEAEKLPEIQPEYEEEAEELPEIQPEYTEQPPCGGQENIAKGDGLTEEQKSIFSYFTLINGMEQQICKALHGAAGVKRESNTSDEGNLLIIGGRGNGKTVLATDFVKAFQKQSGKSGGKVGKISASTLNQKEVDKVFAAVYGGYFIIEKAGDLSRETVDKMSDLMEQDTGGMLVILEDGRTGIEKVLGRNPRFTAKFTEQIKIPVFTSDELVVFARSYAREQGFDIEDMGILALYNSISNIQKLDEATTLTEVKEIMDEAMDRAGRGGLKKLFGGRRTTEDGLILIKEKDFE